MNKEGYRGETALFQSVKYGQYKTASMLIEAGANVNTVNINHDTALMRAAWSGYVKCVALLLQSGIRSQVHKEINQVLTNH